MWFLAVLFDSNTVDLQRDLLYMYLMNWDVFKNTACTITDEQWGDFQDEMADRGLLHPYPLKRTLQEISSLLYSITEWFGFPHEHISLRLQYQKYLDKVTDLELRSLAGNKYVKYDKYHYQCIRCQAKVMIAKSADKQSKQFTTHESGRRHRNNAYVPQFRQKRCARIKKFRERH